MNGDVDALLIHSRCHRGSVVGVVGLPDVHGQRLDAWAPALSRRVSVERRERLLEHAVHDLTEGAAKGSSPPEINRHISYRLLSGGHRAFCHPAPPTRD